jgi:hypothetical protein
MPADFYDRLAAHFGDERVFMDVEESSRAPTRRCHRTGCRRVRSADRDDRQRVACRRDAGHRRLDDPADFVSIETAMPSPAASALYRCPPKAAMPRADQLPADLGPLTRRQAIERATQWDATSAN